MAGYQIRLPRLPLPCCSYLLSPSPSVFFLSTVRCSAVNSPSLSIYLPFAITGVAVIVKKNIETSTTAASRPPAAPIVSASSATSSFSASSSAAASASRVADVSPASRRRCCYHHRRRLLFTIFFLLPARISSNFSVSLEVRWLQCSLFFVAVITVLLGSDA